MVRCAVLVALGFSLACAGCENCGEAPAGPDVAVAPEPDMNEPVDEGPNMAVAKELAEEQAEKSMLRTADKARMIAGEIEASAANAPKPPRPKLKSEPETGKLAKAKLNKEFNIHADAMKGCYERSLKKSPGLMGKVRLELLIKSNGTVGSAKARAVSLQDRAVHNCMERQAQTMKFPAPDGGAVRVNKTYSFTPDF